MGAGLHVAVIPARGGSKSIPRKNLALAGGRPLLDWAADAALGASRIGRCILSTDDPAIAAHGRALGLEVPYLRPAHLAADDTPIIPVLSDLLDHIECGGGTPASLVLLQPTSPLRLARHVDEAVALFEASGASTVVSVTEVPHRFNPLSVMTMQDGRLAPFLTQQGEVLRRQDKPRVFARNGPAVLVVSPAQVREGRLYGPATVGYVMDEESSLDVDDAADLAVVDRALRQRMERA
jgi:CMP-N,N'-diacetyllegionaminic acid synthase